MYYHNVHFFVEKILNLIVIKKHDLMKTNLNICFHNNVFIWYIVEFTTLKRFDLRQINLTKNWINSFKKFFKFNQSIVINSLITKRYFVIDVRNDCESINYVQQIINHVKNINFDNIFHQFIWVWRNLNSKLKRDIDVLDEIITLTQFLKKIELKKNLIKRVSQSK